MGTERLLTTDDVATHLGVKKSTVYAYVSRGLLTSRRNGSGKESLFSEADVRAFAAQRRRGTGAADPAGSPAIHTGITLITGEALYYRSFDADVLARRESFESVAALLWTGTLRHEEFPPDPDLRALAEAVTAPLPAPARLTDRLRVIVAAAGAADRLRFDTTPAAVVATGRTMLATMVSALPARSSEPAAPGPHPFASALWSRLSAEPSTPDRVAALNAALVLLADHDLAASTYAARVAASTRAHPYAVVSAGLATLDGPLHGAASGLVVEMLTAAARSGDALGAVSERMRSAGGVPGFGHPLYPDGDPRAATLLDLVSRLTPAGPALRTALDVAATMNSRAGIRPNVDFALAAFTLSTGMPPDAGEAIFATARTAGWLAHAIEEYADQPSRFRPSGRYAGLPPHE
ncbi:citrate synthase family protein [Couchioplanes caeruleus]|uniref:citrate synthase family protein n=1 Tax=Couchioplanes caeruleus TaxID=56438 RepID=UPI0020C0AA70|nr:citrate synthase family protein [Couchioplanes caeruleus]UQU67859.1 citrate synthase family protein [Couchioplanes caeruleus]